MTFANYESTFSKPRMDKTKTTNPFGQTTKRCLIAAGAASQNYESEFPDYEQRFSNYDWRSSTLEFQTTNGPKILLRNQNSRGQRTTTKLRSLRAYSTLRVPCFLCKADFSTEKWIAQCCSTGKWTAQCGGHSPRPRP